MYSPSLCYLSVLVCLLLTSLGAQAMFEPASDAANNSALNEDNLVGNTEEISLKSKKITYCNFTINEADALKFARSVKLMSINFAYISIKIIGMVKIEFKPNTFLPNMWAWTFNTNHGAYPYLTFHYDVGKLSLGLLDYYTLRGIYLRFEAYPQNCLVHYGTNTTTLNIVEAFGNMTIQHFKSSEERNNSIFCNICKSDKFAHGKIAYYLSLYFGIWYDLTSYKCCPLYRDNHDELKVKCDGKIIEIGQWFSFCHFLSIVIFMYLPIPITYFFKAFGGDCSTGWRENTSIRFYGNKEYLDYSDEQNTLINNGTENCENDESQGSSSINWLYLGLDTPVTIFSAFRRPLLYLNSKYPHLTSKLQRLAIFSILIPLPIIIKIIYYYGSHKYSTGQRLKANIPVGFLSIPYGFEASRKNWLTILGGPYIVFGIYFTLGQICICAPNNWCSFIMSVLQSENIQPNTILSLDLTTLEIFGSVELFGAKGHDFLLRVMKGNLWTILNPEFWKYVLRVFTERFHRVFHVGNHSRLTNCLFLSLYAFVCSIETVCCVLLYGCPMAFYLLTLTRAYLLNCKIPRCNLLFSVVLFICIMLVYYALYLIFIRSSIFILLIFSYVYVGIIIYPNISIGFVVGVGTMLVYLSRSSQKLKDSYLVILQHLISISLGMEKSDQSEHTVAIRDRTLVIKNIDASKVKTLEIGGLNLCLTRDQRHVLSQAHPFTTSLIKSDSKFVRWNGPYPGIPTTLFYYVINKHKPLRGSVFLFLVELVAFSILVCSLVQLVVDFHRVSSFLLPAQIMTMIILTVIPKISELIISNKERQINDDCLLNELRVTVKAYYSEKAQKVPGEKVYRLRALV